MLTAFTARPGKEAYTARRLWEALSARLLRRLVSTLSPSGFARQQVSTSVSHAGFERKWVWVEDMHRGGVFRRADDINTNPVLTEYCRVAGVGAIFAGVGGVILC